MQWWQRTLCLLAARRQLPATVAWRSMLASSRQPLTNSTEHLLERGKFDTYLGILSPCTSPSVHQQTNSEPSLAPLCALGPSVPSTPKLPFPATIGAISNCQTAVTGAGMSGGGRFRETKPHALDQERGAVHE